MESPEKQEPPQEPEAVLTDAPEEGKLGLDVGQTAEDVEAEELDLSTVYVSFSAEINANSTESLIATMANLANEGVATVYLMLSTPGGNIMNGMNIYNVLRGMPFHLVTHNVRNVDSIGNAIFLAGAERYACAHSTFMFHGVGFTLPAELSVDEKFLRERQESLLADQTRIAGIIEERTNLEAAQIQPLFSEAQTKDVAYAVGAGIVHAIKDVDIPPGAPVVSLVFQR